MKDGDKWEDESKFTSIQFVPNAQRKIFLERKTVSWGVMYADLSKNGLTVGQKDKNIAIISVEVNSTNYLPKILQKH
jgi:hypothetical protein